MNYQIVIQEALKVIGTSVKLTGSQQKNFAIIRNHWQLFNGLLKEKSIKGGKYWKKYAITYKNDIGYFYLTGVPNRVDTTGFDTIEFPGGTFAKFQHIGNLDLLKDTYFVIYKEVMPSLNLVVEPNRVFLHYELYDNRFHWNKSDSIIEIFVPITKTGGGK